MPTNIVNIGGGSGAAMLMQALQGRNENRIMRDLNGRQTNVDVDTQNQDMLPLLALIAQIMGQNQQYGLAQSREARLAEESKKSGEIGKQLADLRDEMFDFEKQSGQSQLDMNRLLTNLGIFSNVALPKANAEHQWTVEDYKAEEDRARRALDKDYRRGAEFASIDSKRLFTALERGDPDEIRSAFGGWERTTNARLGKVKKAPVAAGVLDRALDTLSSLDAGVQGLDISDDRKDEITAMVNRLYEKYLNANYDLGFDATDAQSRLHQEERQKEKSAFMSEQRQLDQLRTGLTGSTEDLLSSMARPSSSAPTAAPAMTPDFVGPPAPAADLLSQISQMPSGFGDQFGTANVFDAAMDRPMQSQIFNIQNMLTKAAQSQKEETKRRIVTEQDQRELARLMEISGNDYDAAMKLYQMRSPLGGEQIRSQLEQARLSTSFPRY